MVYLAALAVAGSAHTQDLQNGVDYNLISPAQPTSSESYEIEIAEFFQYSCPGCYAIEPYVQQWQSSKPDDVSLVRVHVVWNPLSRMHAQAFYAAEALGKSEEMHALFFDEFHQKGNTLETEAKLAELFARVGVDREAFEGAFKSFAVHTKLQRADELTRRYRVAATPTLIVQGKYSTVGSLAGSYANWFQTIDRLIETERAAR
jgi:thiol:disulfide interchange protein DsbA